LETSGARYKRLFEQGCRWTDTNLFNGEYHVQKIRGFKKGCLINQLVGQYSVDGGNLGPLVSTENIRKPWVSGGVTLTNRVERRRDRMLVNLDEALNLSAKSELDPSAIMSSHESDGRPWMVVVGGFLGVGKTSLIPTAGSILEKRGIRSAVVFND
jgi:hypothetical protein